MTERKDHIEKRITLDKIEKKDTYQVNEVYFDDLPSRIQNRVIAMEHRQSPGYRLSMSLKFALPVIAIIILSVYFGLRLNTADLDVQAMIDDVSTEELVAYLSESELSTEELIALIDVDELDIDGMLNEDIILFDDAEFDAVLDELPDYETDF